MEETLPIGVLHLDVRHGQVEENRESLAIHAEEAAKRGAKIVVAPELAVSGYSFEGRQEASACAEVLRGPTFERLSAVAARRGVIIAAGIAERDPATDILYNSALVIGPDGELAGHHRKVVAAERRWACPGGVSRSNLLETPWGRLGVLICADSYAGLLPRSLALHGVDLLVVLANWPPSGVDPRSVWRARALENGFGVVACNRTGRDRIMDCRGCRSYVVTASGDVFLDRGSETSSLWVVDYPLSDGRLRSDIREARMSRRRPEDYGGISLDVNGLDDFGGLWGLPAGGPLHIRCVVCRSRDEGLQAVAAASAPCDSNPSLVILPRGLGACSPGDFAHLMDGRPVAVAAEMADLGGEPAAYGLLSPSGAVVLPPGASSVVAEFGPARMALVRPESLAHPETAVSLSKEGCDLLITAPDRLGHDDRLLLGVKCLERVAVAAVSRDGAMICEPPVGHGPWREVVLTGPGVCSARLDTAGLRTKQFYDRVDLEVLLRR